ncbi:MAG: transcriptional regulator [Rectinemataceae bacterium]
MSRISPPAQNSSPRPDPAVKSDSDRIPGALDRIVHEQARLRILTYLASSSDPEVGFTDLRDDLGFTGGNLSTQLKTLESAGYIAILKRFVSGKPFTGVRLSQKGFKALEAYLEDLEMILSVLRKAR